MLVWKPQPRQAMLLSCPAVETFFGGAKGGGKSDALLGDYAAHVLRYGEAAKGILFRKSYSELEELQQRAEQLYPKIGATYVKGTRTWEFPGGGTLKMRFIERDADIQKYQGHQYCVEVSTPILMADGTSRRIDEICIGDYVLTLEGPKRVTDKIEPYESECVESAGQIFPTTHPILTSLGWQSYASVLDNGSKEIEETGSGLNKHLSVCVSARLLKHILVKEIQVRRSTQYQVPCISYSLFDENKGHPRCALNDLQHIPGLNLNRTFQSSLYGGISYVLNDFGIESSSQCDCRFYRKYGGRLLSQKGTAQDGIPLQADAVIPSLSDCKQDEEDSIQEYSRQILMTYEHPYTFEERIASEESVFVPLKLTPCGKHMVSDITVADANHYINADNGIINKNSWIGIDEIGNYSTPLILNHMISCLRSAMGAFCQIRLTGNPGGPGHAWLKRRFIDSFKPDHVYSFPQKIKTPSGEELETEMSRAFIPSHVWDNEILVKNDPSYIAKLMALPEHLRKAFLDGDWDIFIGQIFSEMTKETHFIKPRILPWDWPRFASLDWGYVKPYSVGFWTVGPEGQLFRIHEIYGCVPGMENEGVKKDAKSVAKELAPILNRMGISRVYADSAMWQHHGNEFTISELFDQGGVKLIPARKDRKEGLQLVHSMLQQRTSTGEPMLLVYNTCVDFWRTMTGLVVNPNNPEDIDTDCEDHIFDETKYAVLSPEVMRGMKGNLIPEVKVSQEVRDWAR